MTVADLSILELYCVIAASASVFGFICWSLWGVASDTDRQLSPLGWGALVIASLIGVIGPALYGAYILYLGLN